MQCLPLLFADTKVTNDAFTKSHLLLDHFQDFVRFSRSFRGVSGAAKHSAGSVWAWILHFLAFVVTDKVILTVLG